MPRDLFFAAAHPWHPDGRAAAFIFPIQPHAVPKEISINERLIALLGPTIAPGALAEGLPIIAVEPWLEDSSDPIAHVTAAFLVVASGPDHPSFARASATLRLPPPGEPADVGAFYRDGLARATDELDRVMSEDTALAARWDAAAARLQAAGNAGAVAEALWAAFFPQAVGIRGNEVSRIEELRNARTVTVTDPAADPIEDPAREVLFTSNVLLTVPAETTDVEALPYSEELRAAIHAAAAEPQRYWFDHPIQIGVEPAANELLYGLRGLDAAITAESPSGRVTCVLSVSVTHDGLGPIARQYVEAELARDGELRHLDVVVVTEDATRRLVDEVMLPVLGEGRQDAATGLRDVIGVDGAYGRHYSFLKAVGALWHVAVDPAVRATFKIDLDQVFPQEVLLEETSRTMFDHLRTPLWGASAVDAEGRDMELGMLAGALVNERDIDQGLFTPDVPIPERLPIVDEHVFFSALPQSISTRAEMMARYDGPEMDGIDRALERVHVTGGTNGVRVDALRRHRPFTPSWVGRAEDQAYAMSVLGAPGPRLGYAHAAGLIMRHDKEAFAGQAMAAAHVGKLIGDDIRILVFSSYANAVAGDGADGSLNRDAIRQLLDPFTGCFISPTPQTLVLLRMALRTLRLFAAGNESEAREYAVDGARRVGGALRAYGDPDRVSAMVAAERAAWDDYYDALDALESGIADQDEAAVRARARVVEIIDSCRVDTTRPEAAALTTS